MSKRNKINNLLNQSAEEKPTQAYQGFGDEVFDMLDSAQVSSDTLPIMDIMADITQPRRIVPRDIRGTWAGHPKAWPNLIKNWEEAVFDSGADIPILEVLRGKENPFDYITEEADPIVIKFLNLLDLAGQIHDVGLQQRIGVKPRGKEYVIIYGERRWSAFHLLHYYLGEDYATIPARIAHVSDWELAKIQAAENFHQVELNAISKARQFAKLLMVANAEEGHYDSWQALVAPGGSDRPYYAQVADGNQHRIPRGMGAQFEQTLGISTMTMRKYRSLLRLTGDYEIDNALWDLGDEHDWAEGFMRDISGLNIKTIRQIFEEAEDIEDMLRETISASQAAPKRSYTVPIGTVSPEIDSPQTEDEPIETSDDDYSIDLNIREHYLDKYVRLDDGKVGRVASVPNEYTLIVEPYSDELHPIEISPDNVLSILNEAAYQLAIQSVGTGPALSEPETQNSFTVGDHVSVDGADHDAIITGFWADKAILRFDNGVSGRATFEQIHPLANEDSSLPSPADGDPFQPGTKVKTETGLEGTVIGPAGRKIEVRTMYGTNYFYPDVLTIIEDEFETDDILNKHVMLGDSVTGIVTHVEDQHIRVLRDDNGRILHTVRSDIVKILDDEETDAEPIYNIGDIVWVYRGDGRKDKGEVRYFKNNLYGVFKFKSGSTHYYYEEQLETWDGDDEGSDNTSSDTPLTAAEWVGKPALVEINGQEVPVIVHATKNANEVIVISGNGQRTPISIDRLTPAPEQPGQTITEYYDKPPKSPLQSGGDLEGDKSGNNGNQPVIPYGATVRVILGSLSGLADALPGDIAKKIEALNKLTIKDVQSLAEQRHLENYLVDADNAIQEVVNFILVETGDALNNIAEAANDQ